MKMTIFLVYSISCFINSQIWLFSFISYIVLYAGDDLKGCRRLRTTENHCLALYKKKCRKFDFLSHSQRNRFPKKIDFSNIVRRSNMTNRVLDLYTWQPVINRVYYDKESGR